LVYTVDVKPIGVNGSNVGFADLNVWFHSLTGVNMTLYVITDWLGIVPVSVCFIFALIGFIQLVKRKSLFKVDVDIILTGIYYIVVFACYFIFEMIPINYRPILINGYLEPSYPSSTTLLVICVMSTAMMQLNFRIKNKSFRRLTLWTIAAFVAFMMIGRLLAGVHWFTDIIGGLLLGGGLVTAYDAVYRILEGK
jgi:undecaprenyl-diphosphatase